MTAEVGNRPSGKVAWIRFAICLLVAMPILFLISDAAFRLDRARYYPPLVGALAFGLLAALVAFWVIDLGKVRNVAVGRTVGVFCLIVFHLGFFQRSLIDARTRGAPDGLRGVPVAELVAGLPNYVALRMRNFEANADGEKQTLVVLRWLVFAMETIGLVLLGWWIGGVAAKRPFGEHRRVWMKSYRTKDSHGTGRNVLAWLDGTAPTLESKAETAAETAGEIWPDVLLLEHDPESGGREVGYLTIIERPGHGVENFLAKRRLVPADRVVELHSFFERWRTSAPQEPQRNNESVE